MRLGAHRVKNMGQVKGTARRALDGDAADIRDAEASHRHGQARRAWKRMAF